MIRVTVTYMQALSVWLNGSELRREKSSRFLGVTYDVGLPFKVHVDRVVSKADAGVQLMRCLSGLESWLVAYYVRGVGACGVDVWVCCVGSLGVEYGVECD